MRSKKLTGVISLAVIIFVLITTFQTVNASDGNWQKIAIPNPPPSARYNLPTAAVYASSTNSMVFFGGYNFSQYLDDPWKPDFGSLQWSPLTSNSPGPPAHFAQATVYDAAHDRMVLYAGVGANGTTFQDLWAYEFDAQKWIELPQLSFTPGIRTSPSVIYNPRDTTMILFGGNDPSGNFYNDI